MVKELETREPRGLVAEGFFKQYEIAIKKAMPNYVNGDRLLKTAIMAVNRSPLLLKCHPATIVGGFIQAAQLDLALDGVTGEAYLVPFWNSSKNRYDAQFMVGYKGYRKLVSNSEKVSTFLPQTVYEGDLFEYDLSLATVTTHKRTDKTDPSKPIFFYTVVKYTTGHVEHFVMGMREIEQIRDKHSKSYGDSLKKKNTNSVWHQHPEAMGMKTVMRKHAKYLPLSSERQRAVTLDDMADSGVPQDLGILVDAEETMSEQIENKDQVSSTIPAMLGEETTQEPTPQTENPEPENTGMDSGETKERSAIKNVAMGTFRQKDGKDGKRYTISFTNGKTGSTFKDEYFANASEAKEKGIEVEYSFRMSGKYMNIQSLALVEF